MDTELLVLVIEDESTDFDMLKRSLRRTRMFELVWARSAQEGLAKLREATFDAILLDLSLPDTQGIESVKAFTELASTPVVVLSGLNDESLALESVQNGVHDYLVKGNYDTALLSKTLRYAIERYRLVEELNESKLLVKRERELRRLEEEAASSPIDQRNDSELQESLKVSHPEVFMYAVNYYCALLDKALEQRGFKVENNVSLQLKMMAEALGSYQATPRDVVEIHTLSVSTKIENMPIRKVRLCNEEARYLLTGLLGHLCSFYKSHSRNLPAPVPMPEDPARMSISSSLTSDR